QGDRRAYAVVHGQSRRDHARRHGGRCLQPALLHRARGAGSDLRHVDRTKAQTAAPGGGGKNSARHRRQPLLRRPDAGAAPLQCAQAHPRPQRARLRDVSWAQSMKSPRYATLNRETPRLTKASARPKRCRRGRFTNYKTSSKVCKSATSGPPGTRKAACSSRRKSVVWEAERSGSAAAHSITRSIDSSNALRLLALAICSMQISATPSARFTSFARAAM